MILRSIPEAPQVNSKQCAVQDMLGIVELKLYNRDHNHHQA